MEKMKEKMSKVWSMDKTLVEAVESTGAVIWMCSVNKVFRKIAQKSQNHLCWSVLLMKFKATRPATLLKSDSSKDTFLQILQSFCEQLFCRISANSCFWIS